MNKLFIIATLLLCISCNSQTLVRRGNMNEHKEDSIQFWKTFFVPRFEDTTKAIRLLDSIGAIIFIPKDSVFYYRLKNKWIIINKSK